MSAVISVEAVKIVRCLRRAAGQWQAIDEVAAEAGVSYSAAKARIRRLVGLGLVRLNTVTIPRLARWNVPNGMQGPGKEFLARVAEAEAGYVAMGRLEK